VTPLDRLASIGLAELNRSAGLMSRFDSKYVLSRDAFATFAGSLADSVRVLRDGDRCSFRYVTVYFDDPEFGSYRDHAMGRIRRFKTRVRRYEDSGDTFIEAKMRLPRGETVKVRRPVEVDISAPPTDEMLGFWSGALDEVLGLPLPGALAPSVVVTFDRATLVSEASGERVTVDSRLVLASAGGEPARAVRDDVHVVEVKSPTQRGGIARSLHRAGSHPIAVSKYCMGVGVLHPHMRANAWRPAMRMLGLLDDPVRAA
jgi:hypothetical protein